MESTTNRTAPRRMSVFLSLRISAGILVLLFGSRGTAQDHEFQTHVGLVEAAANINYRLSGYGSGNLFAAPKYNPFISAVSYQPGLISLFTLGWGGHFYSLGCGIDNCWNSWVLQDSPALDESVPLTALSVSQNAISLYARGSGGDVQSMFYSDAYGDRRSGWFSLGGQTWRATAVTAISTVPGGTSLYVIGLDQGVYSKFFPAPDKPGQWTDWFALGGKTLGERVTALSTGPGATSLYVIGTDGQVWSKSFPSPSNPRQWTDWFPLGPNVFSFRATVTAVSTNPGATSLYVIGQDGKVWTKFYPQADRPEWAPWFPLGSNVFSKDSIVTAVSLSRGATSLYVIGVDGRVWSNYFPDTRGQWSGWSPIGSQVFPQSARVAAVSTGPGETSLYVSGENERVWYTYFPHNGLSQAIAAAAPGSTLVVQAGSYPERLTIEKKLTITASGGSAHIGQYVVGTQDRSGTWSDWKIAVSVLPEPPRSSTPPTPIPPPSQPTPPSISVSSEGSGSESIFTLTGSGFESNRTVTIRVTFLTVNGTFADRTFQQSATGSGQLNSRISFPCESNQQLRFSATDSTSNPKDVTGVLWSNTFTTTCP